jgi:hypothetical protein
MNDRVLGKKKTSVTPPQATPASSPLLRRPLTSEVSDSVGSNSNISKELGGIQPKTIRRRLNWENITVEAPNRAAASSTSAGGIQRLETSDVKEQEESKEQQNQELVQTKLTVGAPGDKYEQEADSMAAKVMTMPDSAIQQPIQRQTGEDTEAVQMQPLVNSITPVVQRESGEEEEVQMKSEVQRASDGSSVASGNVENQLAASKGGGSALPDDVRSFMEPRFGADFSSVRVHTDSNAVQMNKELGAQAFAHGSDIYYGAGKSPGKNELTAHELTHTIQQTGAAQLNKSVLPKPELEEEQKQPLQAKELSSSTPEVIQNKLGTGIAPRIQANQQRQSTEPSQFSTAPSELISLERDREGGVKQGLVGFWDGLKEGLKDGWDTVTNAKVGRLITHLTDALGELSPERKQKARKDELDQLSNTDIRKLVETAGSWDNVRSYYLDFPNLMKQLINYRAVEVELIYQAVFESNQKFKKDLTALVGEDGAQKQIQEGKKKNPTDVIIAGSNDLSSDYDVTFAAGHMNEDLETLAVLEFNKLFRARWGLESGLVFDTNVYTTGHMRSPAFKGDVKMMYGLKDLGKILKEIGKEVDPKKVDPEKAQQEKEKLRNEFNKLVEDFNKLEKSEQLKESNTTLIKLGKGNEEDVITKMKEVQILLTPVVSGQYAKAKEDYGTGPEFDELAMVMSLVHMKEFWGQKPDGAEQHPDGANWTHFEKRLGGEKLPENGQAVPERVKEVNNSLLKEVDDIHTKLVKERQEKMKELENDPKLSKNKKNIEMMANNLLYEKYLQAVDEKRSEVRGLDPNASNAVVKQKKLELQKLQSKALFFANEAYMTAISAEQVVLNQQLELGLELPTAQYLASIIEQTTFVGEQIAHITGNNKHGRALWKTSKYINRIVDAINTICAKIDKLPKTSETGEAVPSEAGEAVPSEARKPVLSEDIMTKVRDLKEWGKQLETIKRDSDRKEEDKKRTPKEKDKDAKNVARKVPDLLGTDITGLATKILNLVSDVTLNVQEHLESQKTKNQ